MTSVPVEKANLAPMPQGDANLQDAADLPGASTPPDNQPADAGESGDEARDQDKPDPEKFVQRFSGNEPDRDSPEGKASSPRRKKMVVVGCVAGGAVAAWALARRVRNRR